MVVQRPRQRAVVHALDLRAGQDGVGVQPYLCADTGGHQFVVASEDLDLDTVCGQRLQRLRSRLLRRVQEGHVANQGQAAFVGLRIGGLAGSGLLHRHRHHAQALLVQFLGGLPHAGQAVLVQWHVLAVLANGTAYRQHFFHRALADQLVVVLALGHHHRHAAALEVERNLVHLVVVLRQPQRALQLHVFQHRAVQEVDQPGLEVAVEIGELQHVFRIVAEHIGVTLQRDPVLGERAGLVGAQHFHGAEVLDRIQALDDHLAPRQQHRTLGQGGGDDHRQHLRRQAHRHRQREQKRLGPVTLGPAVDQQHERHHHQREADQQPADTVDAGLECGRRTVGGGAALGQRAEVGAVAGGQHHGGGRSGHHIGAHEQQVVLFQQAGQAVARVRELFHWQRFAGHRGLGDEQVLGGQYAAIGRNHVSGRQHDVVAGHQLADRQVQQACRATAVQVRAEVLVGHIGGLGAGIAAQHARSVADQCLQPLGGTVRTPLLYEADQRGQQYHRTNHHGGLDVLGQPGHRRQHGQQQVERIAVALPQVAPPRQRLFVIHLVGAERGQPFLGLMRAEAIGMRLQCGQQLGFLLLGEGNQAGGERERRGLGAARAKAGFGHRAAAEQVACATAAQEGIEPGVEQAHGTLLECQSRPRPEHERNGWNRSGVAHRQHRRRPRLHVQALAAADA